MLQGEKRKKKILQAKELNNLVAIKKNFSHLFILCRKCSWFSLTIFFNVCHSEVYNTYINIQWCISQTQKKPCYVYYCIRKTSHHNISVMELGHLLTRSGLTYPEVFSKVYHDSFCQLASSVSLTWVIYFEAFCLHVVFGFSCIPLIFPKLVLILPPLQFVPFVF